MNKEAVRLWVDALRSGKYEQAHYQLFAADVVKDDGTLDGRFCCLGVACEVAIANEVPGLKRTSASDVVEGYYSAGSKTDGLMASALPPEVVTWLGLEGADANDPIVKTYAPGENHGRNGLVAESDRLSILNDQYKWDFDRIADVIEKNWLTEEDK